MPGKLCNCMLKYSSDFSTPKAHQAATAVAVPLWRVAFVPLLELCLHRNPTMANVQYAQSTYFKP